MDESKEATKDTKQTSTSAASSEGQKASTSTPQTFTEEQVKAREQKAISDALAKAGREAKAIETAKADITAREAKVKQWEKEREDAELDRVSNEAPEDQRETTKGQLKAYKDRLRAERQEIDKREAALKAKESEWEGLINETKATKFEVAVFTLAEKYGVSADVLKDKAAKLNITDMEAVEELASVMPKKTVIEEPDSGKTAGGGIVLEKARDKINAGFEALHR